MIEMWRIKQARETLHEVSGAMFNGHGRRQAERQEFGRRINAAAASIRTVQIQTDELIAAAREVVEQHRYQSNGKVPPIFERLDRAATRDSVFSSTPTSDEGRRREG